MPFQRPLLSDLVAGVIGDIQSRLPGADATLPRSALNVLATVDAAGLHGLYGYLDFIARQLFPDVAEAEFLERWAAVWGIVRKQPSAATGNATMTGVNGTVVPAASVLARSDGARFATTASATIAGGTATVPVAAQVPGAAGNTSVGAALAFVSPIAGVNSATTVAAGGLTGGNDTETDDALRTRLLARIQQPPQGGDAADYIAWATGVAGVTRAWVYPQGQGVGTVSVAFVMDGRSNIFPLAGDIAAVQAAIDAVRPVTATAFVFAPTATAVNFTIHLNAADTPDIRAAVQAELQDLIAREAIPGGTIYLSHVRQAISNATGEVDSQVTVPAADIVMPAGQMATFGAITWT